MMNSQHMKTGGQLIVDVLECQGVERIFCVPGESYLPVLDALYDSHIQAVVCRQEGGAAMMAEASGKISGQPGICFVTRGPGASNASAGVHIAAQDSTPMILFVGQVATGSRHREAFQEVDYQQFFGGMAKWVAEVDSADRMTEMVSRAWAVATGGRPGPVVIVLPEDALTASAKSQQLTAIEQVEAFPGSHNIDQMLALLKSASCPLAILGGSRWSREAVQQLAEFAGRFALPVATSFRRQMLFDHNNPLYAGDVGLGINPLLKERIVNADVLLMIGGRMSEIPSQDFTLLDIPQPAQKLIHVHPDPLEIGKLYKPALAINASPQTFCSALDSIASSTVLDWATQAKQAHEEFQEWSSLDNTTPAGATMRAVMEYLIENLDSDAVICNGAGNYSGWIHRFWPFREYSTQLASTSGSMGYGLPAAIAAKLAAPHRTVLAFAGDGCFQMTCQEFGTAVQSQAAVVVIVIDNGMYGTIRMHQEKHFPGRVSATQLNNPDFGAWARAYGAYGATVNHANEFPGIFNDAVASGGPALIHIIVDPDSLTPTMSLSAANQ